MIWVFSLHLFRESIGRQLRQGRQLGEQIVEMSNCILPFLSRARSRLGGPAIRRMFWIRRILRANSFKVVLHPKVHVEYQLPYRVRKIAGKAPDNIERNVFNTGQRIGMCALAIQQFD